MSILPQMNHTSPITAELPNSMVFSSNINSRADHSQGKEFPKVVSKVNVFKECKVTSHDAFTWQS